MSENSHVNFLSFIAATIVKCLIKTQGQTEETIAYVLGVNIDELKIKEGQLDYDSYCKILNFFDDKFYKESKQWLICLNSCLNSINQKEQQLHRLLEYSEEFIQNIQATDATIKNIIDFFIKYYGHKLKEYNKNFIFNIYKNEINKDKKELNTDTAYIYICIFYVILKCNNSDLQISPLKLF